MSYEEIKPAKWQYKQHAITVSMKPDFDDFREVQKYLRMKIMVKRLMKEYWNDLRVNLFQDVSNHGLGVIMQQPDIKTSHMKYHSYNHVIDTNG